MHLITSEHELWRKSLRDCPFPEPWWAFLWPGGFALTRWCADHPHLVQGRHVIDFASGCGSSAIQAAKAGANVSANDIDPNAAAAVSLNASANGCSASLNGASITAVRGAGRTVALDLRDIVGMSRRQLLDVEVLLAGDVMYEDELARRVTDWLLRLSLEGCAVFVGDPGRHFLDTARLEQIGSYPLPPELRDENYGLSEGGVWTVKTPRRPCAG